MQLKYFFQDIQRLLGRNKLRILQIIFSRIFWGILIYRFERGLYLTFGNAYNYLRIPLSPFIFLIQAYSNIEVHYKANIKGGLLVHHASVGVVISAFFSAGEKLTLTGGNIIGINKAKLNESEFKIGNNVNLGANATIIGPIELGSNIKIGSLSCVTKSFFEDNIVLVGCPAKKLELK